MTSRTGRPPLVRELLLVAGLFLVYKSGRQLVAGHTGEALHNARHVWDAERALGLPGEGGVQRALLHSDLLVHAANTYYATVHFPATLLLLAWLYWRRPRHYVRTRQALAALTGAALVLHLAFPLAPPRMLGAAHLVDTGQVYGPTVYGAAPAHDTFANQFAAMPSLHVGWALMTAIALITATRSRWRALWLLHPLLTLLVVVGTANHYWLDAVVAAALLWLVLLVLGRSRPATAHRPFPSLVVARSARHSRPAGTGPAEPGTAAAPAAGVDSPFGDAPAAAAFASAYGLDAGAAPHRHGRPRRREEVRQ